MMVRALWAMVLVAAGAASAGEVKVLTTAVKRVTVYPGWARVERAGEVASGERQRLVVRGLPAWVDPESVRAAGEGAMVLAVTPEAVRRDLVSDEALAEAEKAVAAARDRLGANAARAAALKANLEALATVRPAPGEDGKASASGTEALLKFLREARLKDSAEIHALEVARATLAEALAEAEEALAVVTRQRDVEQLDLVLDVTGGGTVTVSYLVCGAGWYPEHTLLDRGGKSMTWRTRGVVQQVTGEDWTQAELVLSATHPLAAAGAPRLGAWALADGLARTRLAPEAVSRLAALEATWRRWTAQDDARRKVVDGMRGNRLAGEQLLRATALRGTPVSMAVAGRHAIASDGVAVAVPAAEQDVEAAITWELAPAVSERVFARAELRNRSPLALLPGRVNVVHGDTLTGRERIGLVGRGESFTVPLGERGGITATRELDRDASGLAVGNAAEARGSERGPGAGERRQALMTLTYRIKVANGLGHAAEVIVRDQIPVADARIAVKELLLQPRARVDRNGVVEWQVSMAAKETRELVLSYQLRYQSPPTAPALKTFEALFDR